MVWTTKVRFLAGAESFYSVTPRPDRLWGPPSPLSNGYCGLFSQGVKRLWCEAYHCLLSSAEVKNAWSYTSTPPLRLHGVALS